MIEPNPAGNLTDEHIYYPIKARIEDKWITIGQVSKEHAEAVEAIGTAYDLLADAITAELLRHTGSTRALDTRAIGV